MSSSRREHRKRTYDSDRESDSHPDPQKNKTKARIIWVSRGQYSVAAFSAINNPAKRIGGDKHEHVCTNCSTIYQHTHPYQKSEHPQHVKDCPNCRKFAPRDRLRGRANGSSQYRSHYNNYSRDSNRRYNEPNRSRPSYRKRSRSRSRSRSPRRRERHSSESPPRHRRRMS